LLSAFYPSAEIRRVDRTSRGSEANAQFKATHVSHEQCSLQSEGRIAQPSATKGISTKADAENYPWCARYAKGGDGENCGFTTID
jgi:hypothetical protein